jgi:hypothetical protein
MSSNGGVGAAVGERPLVLPASRFPELLARVREARRSTEARDPFISPTMALTSLK